VYACGTRPRSHPQAHGCNERDDAVRPGPDVKATAGSTDHVVCNTRDACPGIRRLLHETGVGHSSQERRASTFGSGDSGCRCRRCRFRSLAAHRFRATSSPAMLEQPVGYVVAVMALSLGCAPAAIETDGELGRAPRAIQVAVSTGPTAVVGSSPTWGGGQVCRACSSLPTSCSRAATALQSRSRSGALRAKRHRSSVPVDALDSHEAHDRQQRTDDVVRHHSVAEVHLVSGGDDASGSTSPRSSVRRRRPCGAVPMAPRFEPPIRVGDAYSAVGFGATCPVSWQSDATSSRDAKARRRTASSVRGRLLASLDHNPPNGKVSAALRGRFGRPRDRPVGSDSSNRAAERPTMRATASKACTFALPLRSRSSSTSSRVRRIGARRPPE